MKTSFLIFFLVCLSLISRGQQIVNLTAIQKNVAGVEQIELTWQTINERNFCYFIIERDINYSNNFITRDTLFANGNAPGMTLNYLYTDFGPLQNSITYSYRLRLDTFNLGLCFFNRLSDTVSVNYITSIEDLTNSTSISIYPNPARKKIMLKSNSIINSIEIYNIIGEIVYKITNLNSVGLFSVDISNNPNGVYFVVISSGKKTYYRKLIKQ